MDHGALAYRASATAVFGGVALLATSAYLSHYPPPEQWWYLWPLIVVASAAFGAGMGPAIFDPAMTQSGYEAAWRSAIIWSAGIACAAVFSMLLEGVEIAITRDAIAGAADILAIVPYGPFVAAFAILNALWIIVPASAIVGPMLYAFARHNVRAKAVS